jgi:NAD(P)-dependent dehydrogenase (short-subunit alcohol dehydrogenase family)
MSTQHTPNALPLQGKNILVTGAAQGIGKAYARRLGTDGAKVFVADISEAAIAATASELRDQGLDVTGFTVDVSDAKAMQAFASRLSASCPALHGIVNNAAIFSSLKLKSFWDIDVAEWDRVMAVNVRGPWLVVSALLPLLRAASDASVVNIGSDSVWMGKTGYLHYVTSKAAVYGMTHAMAREMGADNIRVNTLSPGFTTTEVPRETFTQVQLDGIMKAQALPRVATTDEIVGVVAFLMGQDSRWITGQTLHVAGGLLSR